MNNQNNLTNNPPRELRLDFDSPTFESLKNDLNLYLQETFSNMNDKSITEAELTAKITIKLDKTTLPEIDKISENGGDAHKEVLLPTIKHKVTSLMKAKFETDGELGLGGEYELVYDVRRKKYVMQRLLDRQVTLYDEINNV